MPPRIPTTHEGDAALRTLAALAAACPELAAQPDQLTETIGNRIVDRPFAPEIFERRVVSRVAVAHATGRAIGDDVIVLANHFARTRGVW